MKEKVRVLCDRAILLYHVEQMRQQGIITSKQAEHMKRRIERDMIYREKAA